MYSINGEAIRCSGLRPLLGSYPLLGGSVIGGFTVNEIECHIKPEPDNPSDAKATAFQCHIASVWETIGYIVREALDEVHAALEHQKV